MVALASVPPVLSDQAVRVAVDFVRLTCHKLMDEGTWQKSYRNSTIMHHNGVKHIQRAPYHPSSNRSVERFIQTFKNAMKAGINNGRSL